MNDKTESRMGQSLFLSSETQINVTWLVNLRDRIKSQDPSNAKFGTIIFVRLCGGGNLR